jgi:rhodanese-related sulfurtransferase
MPKTIDQLLTEARARLARVDPHAAAWIRDSGGLLVDIRPAAQRRHEGEIPGAIAVERNVLEWRLDPASPDRLPIVTGYHQPIVIVCSEGYASSLAAAVLQDLGLLGATDLTGGFRAWAAAGLPVQRVGLELLDAVGDTRVSRGLPLRRRRGGGGG